MAVPALDYKLQPLVFRLPEALRPPGAECLSAAAGPAVLADEAAFLVNERLQPADRALLPLCLGAVDNVFFQRALNAVLPRVDALVLELQRPHELDDVGYGHTIYTGAGDINIGGAVKFIQAFGYVYSTPLSFSDLKFEQPSINDMTMQQTFGIDVGILYTPSFLRKFNIGLVAKNLNAPTINMKNGADVVLNRQFRAGVSYELLDFLTLAFDADILPNNTLSLTNPKSQMIGGGVLADFKFVDFRLGAMKDLQSKAGEGAILTTGLNLFGFFDVAVEYGLGQNVTLYGFNVSNYMAIKLGGQFSW